MYMRRIRNENREEKMKEILECKEVKVKLRNDERVF